MPDNHPLGVSFFSGVPMRRGDYAAKLGVVPGSPGLTALTDPVKVEHELNSFIPAAERGAFSLRMILHGRAVCIARKPACIRCMLADVCPSSTI